MKVFTRVVCQLGEDGEYRRVEETSYEYEGPIASCDPGTIATTILGGAASALVGGLIGGKGKSPAPPPILPVTPMPDPGATSSAQRRKRAAMMGGGQLTAANTLLGSEDKLGA